MRLELRAKFGGIKEIGLEEHQSRMLQLACLSQIIKQALLAPIESMGAADGNKELARMMSSTAAILLQALPAHPTGSGG